MQLNINDRELVQMTNKLEKLHKSAMPLAVRGTLNDLAFESKKIVEPIFKKQFTIRKNNFIRSHTTVSKSPNTFNISEMSSEMGLIRGKSQAGDELGVHETGGVIRNRVAIPISSRYGGRARVMANDKKLVRDEYYVDKLKIRRVRGSGSPFKSQKFIRTAFKAGIGSIILFNDILWNIYTLEKQERKLFIGLNPLYSFKQNRPITLREKPFIHPAGKRAVKRLSEIYTENAKKRIDKILNK